MPEQDITIGHVGGSKRFACQVVGLPRPSIRWFKDGVNVTTHPRYKFEYTPDGCVVLVLEKVTPQDAGVYECRAQNSEGSAETAALLYVKETSIDEEEDLASIYEMAFRRSHDFSDRSYSSQRWSSTTSEDSVIGTSSRSFYDQTSSYSSSRSGRRSAFDEETTSYSSGRSGKRSTFDEESTSYTSGRSGRRSTFDSGITSNRSSFSSDSDFSFSSDSIKGKKRYSIDNNESSFRSTENGTMKITDDFTTEKFESISSIRKAARERARARAAKENGSIESDSSLGLSSSRSRVDILEDSTQLKSSSVLDRKGYEKQTYSESYVSVEKSSRIPDSTVTTEETKTKTVELSSETIKGGKAALETVTSKNFEKAFETSMVDDGEEEVSIIEIETVVEEGLIDSSNKKTMEKIKSIQTGESVVEKIEVQKSKEGKATSQSEYIGELSKIEEKSLIETKDERIYQKPVIDTEAFEVSKTGKASSKRTAISIEENLVQMKGKSEYGNVASFTMKTGKGDKTLLNVEKPSRSESEERRRGKMMREEEHPGKLDHATKDDQKGRIMAGMYLFYDEPEQEELTKHEIAHEVHYIYNADNAAPSEEPRLASQLESGVGIQSRVGEMVGTTSRERVTAVQAREVTERASMVAVEDTKKRVARDSNADQSILAESVEQKPLVDQKGKVEIISESDINVKEGEQTQIQWRIRDVSIREVSIYKAGKKVILDETHKVIHDTDSSIVTFKVLSALINDTAVYSVRLNNSTRDGGHVNLIVIPKDANFELLSDPLISLKEKERLIIRWRVTGIDSYKVDVFKVGVKLTESDDLALDKKGDICTLTVKSASKDDEAVYSLRARGSNVDEGQTKVKVITDSKVEVLTDNSEIVVTEKERIVVRWKITGVIKRNITICKNGKKISEDGRTKLTFDDDNVCTLTVDSAIKDDTATYAVQIEGSEDEEGQIKVKVIQSDAKVTLLTDESQIIVKEGEKAVIRWKITKVTRKKIIIKKNGKPLEETDKVKVAFNDDNCALTLEAATQEDSAVYAISVDEAEDEGQIEVKVIPVDAKVTVTTDKSEISVKEKETITLKWKITGVVRKKITIRKNGKKITKDSRTKLTFDDDVCTLTVDSAEKGDIATYAVQIEDSDVEEGQIKVKVTESEEKVTLLTDESQIVVKAGEKAYIRWKITKITRKKIIIKKNGKPLEETDKIKITFDDDICALTLEAATQEDSAVYAITVDDAEDEGQIEVKVVSEDTKVTATTDKSEISVKETETISIKWKITGIETNYITIYKNGQIVTENERCKLVFSDDCVTLDVSSAIVDDAATYSIFVSGSEVTESKVKVKVITEESKAPETAEPTTEGVVKPVLEEPISAEKKPDDAKVPASIDDEKPETRANSAAEQTKALDETDSGVKADEAPAVEEEITPKEKDIAKSKPAEPAAEVKDETKDKSQEEEITAVKKDKPETVPEVKDVKEPEVVEEEKITATEKEKAESLAEIKDVKEPKVVEEEKITVTEKEKVESLPEIKDVKDTELVTVEEEKITPTEKDKAETIPETAEKDTEKSEPKAEEPKAQEEEIPVVQKDRTESVPDIKAEKVEEPKVELLTEESIASLSSGNSLEVKWKITGASQNDVTILKDDLQIEQNDKHKLTFEGQICTLSFESVSELDDGVYSVKVKETEVKCGSIKVRVTPAPKIEIQAEEQSKTLKEGGILELKWKITGVSENPVIEVLKDSQVAIQDETHIQKFSDDVCTYSVNPVSASDEGCYNVKVNGAEDEAQTEVKVTPIPKVKVSTEQNEELVKEGDSLTMTWEISGVAKSDVRIYKDGSQIKPAKNMKLKFDNGVCTLSYNPITKTDEATYSIKVKSLDKEQGQIKVKVTSEPVVIVTTEESEKTVQIGESLSMAWKITGATKADVRIYKDGSQIKPAKNMKLKFDKGVCSLTYDPITQADEATYSIKVKGLDKEQGQIKVKVITGPQVSVVTQETEKAVTVGDTLSMAWKISGAAKSDVRILKDGSQIKPAENLKVKFDNGDCTVKLEPVTTSDEATYSIRVKGVDEEQGHIKVKVTQETKTKENHDVKESTEDNKDEVTIIKSESEISTEKVVKDGVEIETITETEVEFTEEIETSVSTAGKDNDLKAVKSDMDLKTKEIITKIVENEDSDLKIQEIKITEEIQIEKEVTSITETQDIRDKKKDRLESSSVKDEVDDKSKESLNVKTEISQKSEVKEGIEGTADIKEQAEINEDFKVETEIIQKTEVKGDLKVETEVTQKPEEKNELKVETEVTQNQEVTDDLKIVCEKSEKSEVKEDLEIKDKTDQAVTREDIKVETEIIQNTEIKEDLKTKTEVIQKPKESDDIKVETEVTQESEVKEDIKVEVEQIQEAGAKEDLEVLEQAEISKKVKSDVKENFEEDVDIKLKEEKIHTEAIVEPVAKTKQDAESKKPDKTITEDKIDGKQDDSIKPKKDNDENLETPSKDEKDVTEKKKETQIQISTDENQKNVKEGDKLSLTWNITGQSETDVGILKDGTQIESTENVKLEFSEEGCSLTFNPVDSLDTGTYSVKLNDLDKDDCKITVKVESKTDSSHPLDTDKVVVGEATECLDISSDTVIETSVKDQIEADVSVGKTLEEVSKVLIDSNIDNQEIDSKTQSEQISETSEVVSKTLTTVESKIDTEESEISIVETEEVIVEKLTTTGEVLDDVSLDVDGLEKMSEKRIKSEPEVLSKTETTTTETTTDDSEEVIEIKTETVTEYVQEIVKEADEVKDHIDAVDGQSVTNALQEAKADFTVETDDSVKMETTAEMATYLQTDDTTELKAEISEKVIKPEQSPTEKQNEKEKGKDEELLLHDNKLEKDIDMVNKRNKIDKAKAEDADSKDVKIHVSFEEKSELKEPIANEESKFTEAETVKQSPEQIDVMGTEKLVTEGDSLSMVWNVEGAAKSDVWILKDGTQIKPAKNMKVKFDNGDCTLTFNPVSTCDEATYAIKVKGMEQEQGQIKVKVSPEVKEEIQITEKIVEIDEKLDESEKTKEEEKTKSEISKKDETPKEEEPKEAEKLKEAEEPKKADEHIMDIPKEEEKIETQEKSMEVKVQEAPKAEVKPKEAKPEVEIPKAEKEDKPKETEKTKMMEKPKEDKAQVEEEKPKEKERPEEAEKLKEADEPKEEEKQKEEEKPKEKPKEEVKPKETETPKEDEKLKEEEKLKEAETPREDEKPKEEEKPKEVQIPKKEEKESVPSEPQIGVTTMENEKSVTEGEILTMAWNIKGATKADVRVFKDGAQIKPAKNMKVKFEKEECSLVYNPVASHDSGTYSIKIKGVEKEQGQIKVKVNPKVKEVKSQKVDTKEVTVEAMVQVLTEENEKMVIEGDTLSIAWNIKGATKADVGVFKDGAQIKPAKNMKVKFEKEECSLVYNPVASHDSGTYSIKIKGVEKEQGHIKVKINPKDKEIKSQKVDTKEVTVETMVQVLTEENEKMVIEGDTLSMAWNIKDIGATKADVRVFKDGAQIKPAKNMKLKFEKDECSLVYNPVDSNNSGTYSIKVKGVEKEQGHIKVQVNPKVKDAKSEMVETKEVTVESKVQVVTQENEKTVVEGEILSMAWDIKGATKADVRILKDGTQIKPAKNMKLKFEKEECSLIYNPVGLNDLGTYAIKVKGLEIREGQIKVKINSKATEEKSDATVKKEEVAAESKIEVVSQENEKTVVEGDSLSMAWNIKGATKADVRIFKDGAQIKPAKNMKLKFEKEECTLVYNPVTSADSGTYVIKVKGLDKEQGQIKVKVNPKFTQEKEVNEEKKESAVLKIEVTTPEIEKSVLEGEALSMTWKVKGATRADVRILKDGAQIKPAKNMKLKFEIEDCCLTYNPVSTADEGMYSIKVKGVEKEQGQIKVKVKPAIKVQVTTTENEMTVKECDTLSMAWKIKGASKADVRVFKDGSQIKPAKNMKLKFYNGDCTLSYNPVATNDEGVYSVKVKGLDKEQGQIKVKVIPLPKVEVTTAESEKTVKEGKTLSLSWSITGASKADVSILKDGVKIKPASNMKLKFDNGDCTLTFNPVSIADQATYCVKVKGLESEQGQIKVKVSPEPNVEAVTKNSSVIEGDSLDLKWNVTGAVESDISISKDGKRVKKDTDHKFSFTGTEATFSVKPVTKDDEGSYQVKVKGQGEKTQGQINVKVNIKEQPKLNPKEPAPVKAKETIVQPASSQPICEVLDEWPDPEDFETLNAAPKPKPVVTEVEQVEEMVKVEEKDILLIGGATERSVNEGKLIEIKWDLQGTPSNEVDIFKDGFKIKEDDKLMVAIEEDTLSLKIELSTLMDEATYSVKKLKSDIHEGQVFVKVAMDETKIQEPTFTDEPKLEILQDRRLSLKCAVTGYPEPNVTWYHEGQQLGQDALWDVYTREGYHYLAANNKTFIDGSEILCRIQNQAGYQDYALAVKKEGSEVYCDPIYEPVIVQPEDIPPAPPKMEAEISATSPDKLRKYTVITDFLDDLNGVSMTRGDRVQLLAGNVFRSALLRDLETKTKTSDDINKQECRNLLGTKIALPIESQTYTVTGTQQPDTMPERRMKSSSPQMTSTPKVKRKGNAEDDTSEMRSRLGLKDTTTYKKEVSHESVELTSEYTDGTTRPTFKKRLRNTAAKAGELAQLECVVSGSPLPKVLWLKNNRPLKASDGCKVIIDEDKNILVFPAAKDDDVGIYTARAMNVNGSIMCSAEFTLTEGKSLPAQSVSDSPMDLDFTTPAYFFQMSSCEVAEGRLARFDCRVVAYPKPEIVWMRDGKVIETSDRFKLLNFNNEIYSLLIQDVQLSDTGRYTCWARNKFGEAMTEAYLNVIAFKDQPEEGDIAPKFLTRFYDQQTTEGTPTDFKCLIAGQPEPSVTWLLNDIELKDSLGVRTRHKDGVVSLELKSPKIDQSGQYTCQLKNTLGEATCSAKLTVIEDQLKGKMLPKFLKKFDHINAREGEDVKFTCVVVGEPKPNITWMYNHKPISDSNRHYAMKQEGDSYTLIIKDARFDDKGIITCKASSEEGEVYISANLNIRESKKLPDIPETDRVTETEPKGSQFGYVPTFTKRMEDISAKEGASAWFECRIMGIPEPEVSWMKDGRVILPGGRYHMTHADGTCRLSIDNVTSSDTGVYTCIISNSQGKSSSTASLRLETEKKDFYIPERPVKKELFTPDKYDLEDKSYTKPKRPYVDLDKIEARARPRRYSFDSSILPSKYEDISSQTLPKRTYDSPSRYESASRYDSPLRYGSPGRYESPKRRERPKSAYEPAKSFDLSRSFDIPKSYESPRKYESYESPRRFESPKKYESPKVYDYDLYESPKRYESPRSYESSRPRRPESPKREKTDDIPIVPKLPYDRPNILHKHEDSVRLSWLPAPTGLLPLEAKQVTYIVESRELPRQDWIRVGSHVPVTSYLVKNLRPDKAYEFRIRAQNIHGISEPTWSAALEKRVDMAKKFTDLPEMRAPPRLPTHRPIVTDMGEDILRLAWRPAETYQAKRAPPVSYRLEAKELPGKDWMPLSSRLRDTSHYLSELPVDRDYMIRVRAENDFGISEPTEPLWLPRARAFPGVPISRPEIVEVEDSRAKLRWTRVDIPSFGLTEDPLLYMLEVEEPPYDWRTIARDLDDTEYIVEGLKPGRDYRFRIRAKTPAGVMSEPSPAASLYSTLAQTRAPVDRLELIDFEPDTRSINLQWQRVDIPPYTHDEEPLLYMLEYQEPPIPEWRSLVTGIPTTKYRVMHLDPDRDYNFRVRAVTPYGVSPPSPILPVTVKKPLAPSIRPMYESVVISEIEPDSLRLSWQRPMYDQATPVSYKVEMLEFPLSDWKCIASSIPETTYRVTGLRPNRDYQFRVTPQVDRRYLDPLPPVSLTSSTVRPRLPLTEPILRELTAESVSLNWKPAEVPVYQRSRAPLYYTIEMLELPSNSWTPVARRVPETTYTVTGLRPDVDYKFRVKAEIGGSFSEASLPAVLHRRPVPKFPRKEPTIKDISPNIVQLSWQPAILPIGFEDITYRVEIQSPPGISTWNILYANHPTPSVRLADLRPDLDYLVRVRAVGKDFVSEPTMPLYIPRRAVPPRMPHEEPYCVEINPDSIKLQWRSADLPTHIMDYSPITYRLEAQEMPNGEWIVVSRGIPHTDFKVTGLNPLKDYSFRVRAENDYGVSDPTRPVAINKRAVAPLLPHDEPLMYDVGSGSIRLTWRPATLPSYVKSTSPIAYTIFVQELPFKTWRPLVKKIPHTSYYISGLQPEKDYNFRVTAENEFGQSRPTQAVYLPKFTDIKKPISMPEVSDFDEDLTFVKLRWKPRASPHFDKSPRKYQIETWEPIKREWKPVARGIKDTTYKLRDLPKLPDHLFRVRMETEHAELSEPSLPVSVGRHISYPRRPVYRPQLFEFDEDSVRLSWQPVTLPEGVSRRTIRYVIEQREIPDMHWYKIASDITETSYRVRGLRPKSDYEFRIRVVMDGTTSEPSFPVALYRRPVIPRVQLQAPEVYDVDETTIQLRWNKVDVPQFSSTDEPLMFMIERQTLPGYRWEPIAMDVSDTTYTVKNLKPYQDYNFRVRGVYPSGFTEPSPYVPVFRRPSESKKSALGFYEVVDSEIVTTSQRYSSEPLPSQSLKASIPSDYSPAIRTAKQSRLVNRTFSPKGRLSMSEIYDIPDKPELREAPFRPPIVPPARFIKEEAYVYKRGTSPAIPVDFKPKITHIEAKSKTYDRQNDLYDYYRKLRRHSDAGIEEIRRSRSESSREREMQARREIFILESEFKNRRRASQSPATKRPVVVGSSDYDKRYPSVADRYEDIKCPHVVRPGHWQFARRHSISLDDQDLEVLKRSQTKLVSFAKTPSKSNNKSKTDLDLPYYKSPDDSSSNTYFIIQEDMNLEKLQPMARVSRVDMNIPSHLRSFSFENEPGYFVFSKFSLSVLGHRSPTPTRSSSVRPMSVEPSPTLRVPVRAVSYDRFADKHEDRYRKRSQSLSLTRSQSEWDTLHKSVQEQIEKAHELRRKRREKFNEQMNKTRTGSVSSSKTYTDYKTESSAKTYSRPRSSSVSYSSTNKPAKFNALVENSKSLVAKSNERGMSVDLKMQDSHTGYRSRTSSVSIPRDASKPRSYSVADVKTDPRYSSNRQASITATQITVEKRSSVADVKSDPRFSFERRSTLSTNDDIKSKLDTLTSKLSFPKPKAKKSSRPVIKFKSSQGEGYVTETYVPKSDKLKDIYHKFK